MEERGVDGRILGYYPSDPQSILEYAERLEGHTLRQMTDAEKIADSRKRKGSFGNAMEEYYFDYAPNSSSEPDFAQAGVELKTTPMKHVRKNDLVAKERLVISMIDYMDVVNETFETSHFMEKARDILLVTYLWEKDTDPLDYEVIMADLWTIPEEDLPQIKRDWETVVDKVRAGHAEDISSSDTMYLEACTKSATSANRREQPFSSVPAKPRAWAFKSSYMTAIEQNLLGKKNDADALLAGGRRSADLIEIVRERFASYFGQTEEELARRFGISRSKNRCARITKRILGVDEDSKIEEFEKANIKPKTMRVRRRGMPKEDMSFPAFDYFELAETDFKDSDFYDYLQQKYLFVIYREDEKEDDVYRLSDVMLWQMPDKDLDEAERCYDQMQKNVREGHAEISVRSTENRCCHVRPHGRDRNDTRPQPYGKPVVKKCFWLSKRYLHDELVRGLHSEA